MPSNTPDDYTGATLGQGTLSYESCPPRVEPAPRTYTIVLLTRGAKRDHYRMDFPSVGGDPVTVSYHRTSGNVSCATCHSANSCSHASALREWMADQPRRVA